MTAFPYCLQGGGAQESPASDEDSDEVKLVLADASLKVFSELSGKVRALSSASPQRYHTSVSDFTFHDDKTTGWSKKLNGEKTMFGDKYAVKQTGAQTENSFTLTLETGLEDGEKRVEKVPAPDETFVALLIDQSLRMGQTENLQAMNEGLESYFNAMAEENNRRLDNAMKGMYSDIDPAGDVAAQMDDHLIKVIYSVGYNRDDHTRHEDLDGYLVKSSSDVQYMLERTQVNVSGTPASGGVADDYRIGSAMESMERRLSKLSAYQKSRTYLAVFSLFESEDHKAYEQMKDYMVGTYGSGNYNNKWFQLAYCTNLYIYGVPDAGPVKYASGGYKNFGHWRYSANQINWYLDAARRIKGMGIKVQSVAVNMNHQVDMVEKALQSGKLWDLDTNWWGGLVAVIAGLSSSDFPVNSHFGIYWSWVSEFGETQFINPSHGAVYAAFDNYKGFVLPPDFVTCGYFGFPSDFIARMNKYAHMGNGANPYGMLYYDLMRYRTDAPDIVQDGYRVGTEGIFRPWFYDFKDGYSPNELGHYAYLPEDASEMVDVSRQLLNQQSGGTMDGGYASGGAVVQDEISDAFDLADGRSSIRVYKVARIPADLDESGVPGDRDENGRSASFRWGLEENDGSEDGGDPEWQDITDELSISIAGKKIRVSGFDYEQNALTDYNKYGRDVFRLGDYGYKLVVQISVTGEDTLGGNGIRTNFPDGSVFKPAKPGLSSGLPDWKDNSALNPSGSENIEKFPVPLVDLFPTREWQVVAEGISVYAPQWADMHNLVMDAEGAIFYEDPLYQALDGEVTVLQAEYERAAKASTDLLDEIDKAGNGMSDAQKVELAALRETAEALSKQYAEKLEERDACVRCVPDGRNNQFVTIRYELLDPDGAVVGRLFVPRGTAYTGSNLKWDFSAMGADERITKSGIYTVRARILPAESTVSPNGHIYTDTDVAEMPADYKDKYVGSSPYYIYHSSRYSCTGSRTEGDFKGTLSEKECDAKLYQLHVHTKDTRLVPDQTVDFHEGIEVLSGTDNVHITGYEWIATDGSASVLSEEPGITGSLAVGQGGVNMSTTIPQAAWNEGKVHKVGALTACGSRDGFSIPVAVQLSRSCGTLDRAVSKTTQVVQTVRYLSDSDNIFGVGQSSVVWDHACSLFSDCDDTEFKDAAVYGTADNGEGAGRIRYLVHVENNPMPVIEKEAVKRTVARGEALQWDVSVSNDAETENPKHLLTSFSLVDVLPYNGDGRIDPKTNYEGSDFHGGLSFSSASFDLSKAAGALAALESGKQVLFYTTDASVRTASEEELIGSGVDWKTCSFTVSGKNVNLSGLPEDVTALRFDMGLSWGEKAALHLSLLPQDENTQANGDRYHNQAGAYNGNGGRFSEVSAVTVALSSLSGRIWEDADGNGLSEDAETGLSDIPVTLYQEWTDKNPNSPDRIIDGTKLVRVYDLNYDRVPSVVTDDTGYYLFDEVNPGTYYIVADGIPEKYSPAGKNAGAGDPALSEKDSACEETFGNNADKTLDNTAWIKKVVISDASVTGQNFGMQLITGEIEVTKYLDEIYYPSSMTDAEREDYRLVFTFRLRNTENGKEYKQAVRVDENNLSDGSASCIFKDLPLGTYDLTEEPSAQYVLDHFSCRETGQENIGSLRITVTPKAHDFSVDAYNRMEKDPPGGDENGVSNFVNVRVPVSLDITYTGPDPVGNKSIIRYQFRKSDFADIVVTYDDGTHISLKEGTLRFEDVTLTPSVVTNLMNTDGKKLTVNGFYSEKGRVVKDSFRVAVDLKPVHKFRLTFDANGSSFDTGSTKNIVNFAYDDNAGYNIVTSGIYRDVANGGLKPYGSAYQFAGWNTKYDGTGVNYTDRTALDAIGKDPTVSTLTLYAQWTCKVTFNGNGCTIVKANGAADSALLADERAAIGRTSASVTWNVNQTIATNLAGSRSGHSFVLWNTKPDGTGTDLTKYGRITGPVTFYAISYQSDYAYTGGVQTFRTPVDGIYRITCVGASGGQGRNGVPGQGGTTWTDAYLRAGTVLYVYVGGQGGQTYGGYNGGGTTGGYHRTSGGGGGATDVRLNGSLESRIVVAGGGGGSDNTCCAYGYGGNGGGLVGGTGSGDSSHSAYGGTQSAGGYNSPHTGYCANGGFGYGASSGSCGGSGGSGWFGGAGSWNACGGGGSSYILDYPGTSAAYRAYQHGLANIVMGRNIGASYNWSIGQGGNWGHGRASIVLTERR